MNFTESTYRHRLFQLVPRDCFTNIKRKDPVTYLEKRILKIDDDQQCVYWYSISFVAKEFHRLPYSERKNYLFDREIFRCKYIKLAKLELLYQLVEYVNENQNALLLVGERNIVVSIEYILYLILNINFYTIPLYFYGYEFDRIRYIQQKSSEMFFKLIDFRFNSSILFFQIFYKGTLHKYNLEPGLLEQIYNYTFDEFYAKN